MKALFAAIIPTALLLTGAPAMATLADLDLGDAAAASSVVCLQLSPSASADAAPTFAVDRKNAGTGSPCPESEFMPFELLACDDAFAAQPLIAIQGGTRNGLLDPEQPWLATRFNPKSEVDRGDLSQSVGRKGLSSELSVSLDTQSSSSSLFRSTACAISSPPTSDFGFYDTSAQGGFPYLNLPTWTETIHAAWTLAFSYSSLTFHADPLFGLNFPRKHYDFLSLTVSKKPLVPQQPDSDE